MASPVLLHGMKINRMGETDINEFLKAELPKHLEKYAKTHIHHTNINRILDGLINPKVIALDN